MSNIVSFEIAKKLSAMGYNGNNRLTYATTDITRTDVRNVWMGETSGRQYTDMKVYNEGELLDCDWNVCALSGGHIPAPTYIEAWEWLWENGHPIGIQKMPGGDVFASVYNVPGANFIKHTLDEALREAFEEVLKKVQ